MLKILEYIKVGTKIIPELKRFIKAVDDLLESVGVDIIPDKVHSNEKT
jgi:hypothetical protein